MNETHKCVARGIKRQTPSSTERYYFVHTQTRMCLEINFSEHNLQQRISRRGKNAEEKPFFWKMNCISFNYMQSCTTFQLFLLFYGRKIFSILTITQYMSLEYRLHVYYGENGERETITHSGTQYMI